MSTAEKAKHTPGPWSDSDERAEVVRAGADGRIVATNHRLSHAEWCANARLIAAAPELAEALRGLMQLIDDKVLVRNIEGDHEPHWAMNQLPLVKTLAQAQTALKKAGL